MKSPEIHNIRNFVIISHIDHGKSTLADRFLELTKTISKEKMRSQYLDSMDLEREKGITIKMHPVRMLYRFQGAGYVLNLIDTPGHIDFNYEISRALACVEGAVLLVDATKGIQAQTIFNLEAAQKQNLIILPAVNKIDLGYANIEETRKELASLIGVSQEEVFAISAKQGTNTKELLEGIIKKVRPPRFFKSTHLRALIFDSRYDPFYGVVLYVRIFEGAVKKGEKIYLMAQDFSAEVKEVGYFVPEFKETDFLGEGEVGYIKTNIKDPSRVRVGDTVCRVSDLKSSGSAVEPLPGYRTPEPVLFLSIYPQAPEDFDELKTELYRLKLNDPSLSFHIESNPALGRGFRCGFLGSLHAEITIRRLKEGFKGELLTTSPQVIFRVLTKDNKEIIVSSPELWPPSYQIKEVREPIAEIEIVSPQDKLDKVFSLLKRFNVQIEDTQMFSSERFMIKGTAALKEVISGVFYDSLKSATEGYASFSFRQRGFQRADLVKLDILIAGEVQPSFSRIVEREKAFVEAKKILQKLKEVLPPQQFEIVLQAKIDGRIIARETKKALRKDVTAPLYGGDVTRKRKLLEKQKKGKKELKAKGRVNIPYQVFLEMFKT